MDNLWRYDEGNPQDRSGAVCPRRLDAGASPDIECRDGIGRPEGRRKGDEKVSVARRLPQPARPDDWQALPLEALPLEALPFEAVPLEALPLADKRFKDQVIQI
ncbi:hypothetical protein ACQ5SK_01760 [Bradyrhizobium japonicum]